MLGKGWVQRGKFSRKAVLALLVGLGLVPGAASLPPWETSAPLEPRGAKGCCMAGSDSPASLPHLGFAGCPPCPCLDG